MGHGPDALQGAQDVGARVFDCMLTEADDLLEEAQAEWFCAAGRPEAALEGLRAAGFLAAVGVWLASMRGDSRDSQGNLQSPRPGLSPILPPPRASGEAEDPALQRLRALSARAARLYERAVRLDGLLSGSDEARTPAGAGPRPEGEGGFAAAFKEDSGGEARGEAASAPAAGPKIAQAPSGEVGGGGHPGARGRQIWLSRALAAEAWG